MNLIIDHREKDRIKLATQYYTKQKLDVSVGELTVGDFLFIDGDKQAIFEYKTVLDMVSSIQDNRVFNQVNTLSEEYHNRFLVIQGTEQERVKALAMTRNYGQRITVYQYISALARLSKYITIIQVNTPYIDECFFTMLEYTRKTFDEGELYHRFQRKNRNPALNFLMSIYGLSHKRSKLIVDTYNLESLTDLMTLNIDKLTAIEGIGESTGRKIMEALK